MGVVVGVVVVVLVSVVVSLPFLPVALFTGEDPPGALAPLVGGDSGVLLERRACSDVEGCIASGVASGERAFP